MKSWLYHLSCLCNDRTELFVLISASRLTLVHERFHEKAISEGKFSSFIIATAQGSKDSYLESVFILLARTNSVEEPSHFCGVVFI